MKKLLTVFLITALSLSCLAGCGSSESTEKETTNEVETQQTEETSTEAEVVESEDETEVEETETEKITLESFEESWNTEMLGTVTVVCPVSNKSIEVAYNAAFFEESPEGSEGVCFNMKEWNEEVIGTIYGMLDNVEYEIEEEDELEKIVERIDLLAQFWNMYGQSNTDPFVLRFEADTTAEAFCEARKNELESEGFKLSEITSTTIDDTTVYVVDELFEDGDVFQRDRMIEMDGNLLIFSCPAMYEDTDINMGLDIFYNVFLLK